MISNGGIVDLLFIVTSTLAGLDICIEKDLHLEQVHDTVSGIDGLRFGLDVRLDYIAIITMSKMARTMQQLDY